MAPAPLLPCPHHELGPGSIALVRDDLGRPLHDALACHTLQPVRHRLLDSIPDGLLNGRGTLFQPGRERLANTILDRFVLTHGVILPRGRPVGTGARPRRRTDALRPQGRGSPAWRTRALTSLVKVARRAVTGRLRAA